MPATNSTTAEQIMTVAGVEARPGWSLIDGSGNDWSWAYVVFRPLPGHITRVVSSEGHIWSLKVRGRWKRLRGGTGSGGYLMTNEGPAKQRRTVRINILVLRAFLGPAPPGMCCCHANDIPHDNRLVNLRWGTVSTNTLEAIKNGRTAIGSRKRNSKLTEADVVEIRRLRVEGMSQSAIAERFGVHRTRISFIDQGHNWKHVPCDQAREIRARPYRSKLSRSDLAEIEAMWKAGARQKVIAERFKISKSHAGLLISKLNQLA